MAGSRKLFAALKKFTAWLKPKIPFPDKREIHASKRITAAIAEEIHAIQLSTFIKI
jgi:hypothetical protein